MSRFSICFLGLLTGILMCSASPGQARGDQADDEKLARMVVTAAEKSSEYQDNLARYGAMAEIAQSMLVKREQQADLVLKRDNLNIEIAKFPPRKWWLAEHHEVHDRKLDCDQQLALLRRQIEELDLQQRRMYEAELERARVSKKRFRPIRREAILDELHRLDNECDAAFAELKDGIDAAAKEERSDRRAVWERIKGSLENLEPRPDVSAEALREFVKQTERGRWLNGGTEPRQGKTRPRTGKSRRG